MSYGFFFFLAFLLTIVVEIPVLFLLVKYLFKLNIPIKEILYWGIFINSFSLPYLWFVLPLFITSNNYTLIGEIFVVLVESVILSGAFKIGYKKAIILSIVTNVASYIIGLIVFR